MAGLIRDWDKSRPPTGKFQLNKNCPQAQGLVAWYPFANVIGSSYALDLVSGLHLNGNGGLCSLRRSGSFGETVGSFLQSGNENVFALRTPGGSLAMPLSLTAWGFPDSSTQTAISVQNSVGATEPFHRIVLVSGKVRANSGQVLASQGNAITTASYNVGEWNLFGGTFASTTSRTVYLNGGNAVNNTTSVATVALTGWTSIGAVRASSDAVLQSFNGQIGECGIWNIALSPEMHYRLYDRGTRYELWYPLRSPKWISMTAEAAAGGLRFHPGMEGQMSKRMDGGLNA